MKKLGHVVVVIVLIAVILGAISAGVGLLTGADAERVNAVLVNRVEDGFNVDPVAFVHEWLPETFGILRQEFLNILKGY